MWSYNNEKEFSGYRNYINEATKQQRNGSQCFIISVVDHSAFLSFLLLLLKLKILLKHRCKAVAFQQSGLLNHLFRIGWQILEIKQQREAVSCK